MAGKKSHREFLDMSVFTDNLTKAQLYTKTISNELAWDVFGGKTEFRAVVLSPPILLAAADADLDGTQHSEGDDSGGWFSNSDDASSGPTWQSNKFAFKARILGNPSPHDFLQDPCEIAFTENPQKVMRLISLHTTFITSDDTIEGATSVPKIGDVVNVELEPDEFSYNLQFGKYTSIATATTAGLEGAPSGVSERLAQQAREAGADVPEPAPGGLSCFSLGALFVDFDADIFASDDGTRVRARSTPAPRQPSGLPTRTAQPSAGSNELPPTTSRRTLTIAKAIDDSSLISQDVVRSANPIDAAALRSVVERLQRQWRKPDGSTRLENEPEVYTMLKAAWCHTVPRYCADDADWGPGRSGGYRHWSGAWISYMLSLAGASTFPRSWNHNIYDEQGWYNRQNNTGNWYTYSLQTEAVAISVGDVLTYPSYCNGCSYEYGHADVVWKITDNRIYTAGGNITNTMHSTMYIPYTPDPQTGEAILGRGYGSSQCRGCGSGQNGNYVVVLKKMT